MTDRGLHIGGILVTVLLHGAVVGGAWGLGSSGMSAADRARLDEPVVIEAGLARRAKSGGKKSRLPSKDLAPAVKPDAEKVAIDGAKSSPTTPPDPKPKDRPTAEEIDPAATFEKFRQAGARGEATGQGGADDGNQTGAADGSEWGTLDTTKGDPYVGELVGRMTTNPDLTVPSIVPAGGLETWGCVKLDGSGKITDRELPDEHRSANKSFNRAVEERLKQTSDMEQAAPKHLVGRWLCVPYRY